jgi:hypothetical protein
MGLFYSQLKQVLRRLGRAPLFTAVTLITMAVGTGATTAVFTVVEIVLFKPLSYEHPDRLMGVWYKAPGMNIPKLGIAQYLYFIDREQSKTLEDIGMVAAGSYTMTGSLRPALHAAGRLAQYAEDRRSDLRLLATSLWRGSFRRWAHA